MLSALLLLLAAAAAATAAPPPPSSRPTPHKRTGANADLRHCHEARDARNLLLLPELPSAASIFFEVRDHPPAFFSLDAPLLHAFELPYLAFDARYTLSFRTARGALASDCSSEFVPDSAAPALPLAELADLAEPSDWSEQASESEQYTDSRFHHAPNAAYSGALNDTRYGAYYTSPKSCWRVAQSEHFPCSSVVYSSGGASLADLQQCGALSVLALGNDTVRVAAYTLVLALETPTDKLYGANRISVGVYADRNENTLRVTLMNGRTFNSPQTVLSATVGGLSVAADDGLRFTLIVRTHEPLHRDMLTVHAQASSSLVLDQFSRRDNGIHYLSFVSNRTLAVYSERLTIDIRTHRHTHTADVASVVIDLHVANPEAVALESADSYISNHIALYNERGVVGRDDEVADQSRICMVNSVSVPAELQPAVAVELVEAWLCVIPVRALDTVDIETASTGDRLACAAQRHRVELFSQGRLRDNATIVAPGRLGATSVELCFNASLQIVDNDRLTLEAPNQRYESQIRLVPRIQTLLFAALQPGNDTIVDDDERGKLTLDLEHDLAANTPAHLQRSIFRLRAEHTRATTFAIASLLGTSHGTSAAASNVVLLLVFLMFFCVVAVYVVLSTVDVSRLFRRTTYAEFYQK